MDDHDVVTCFLRHGTEVLLVRRSEAVGSYPGMWGGVSGYAEGTPEEAARWEIAEEVGLLNAAAFVRSADPLVVEDETRGVRWHVHPFLFDCDSREVDPNDEVADYEWVHPPEMLNRETVPRLWEAYTAVAPTVETVRKDADHGSAYVSLRALEALRDGAATAEEFEAVASLARELRDSRPEMGVVRNRINRVLSTAEAAPEAVGDRAMLACERAMDADSRAATRAAEVLGNRVLTLSRSGTALEAVRTAAPDRVYVAESRPGREGVGVAEELADADIDVSLVADAAVGHAIETEGVETVLVGADSILADGTVINKVGTRPAALAAADAGVDRYVVCSRDKIIPEERVELASDPPSAFYRGDRDLAVHAPRFEPIPTRLFTGIVTEDGLLESGAIREIADEHAESARWDK